MHMRWHILGAVIVGAMACGDNSPPNRLDTCATYATRCPRDDTYELAMHNGCPRCFHRITCKVHAELDEQALTLSSKAPVLKAAFGNVVREDAVLVAHKGMLAAIAAICALVGVLIAAAMRKRRQAPTSYYSRIRNPLMEDADENDDLNPFCQKLPLDDASLVRQSPRAQGVLAKILQLK
ncbi:hypothetical protein SPRG_04018 [Saprolegnia parasitica CBS 223.65]|uniref:TNFR-Cys domain-containing protein n=1 Tax=Saprolegnia parasitica (strain CBS 223.65) TaxID=695850 RepID=A0A067CXZ8_SAPPC|nr:hypothetical protein SPRG_04018 [Saprolegnia parasitica CBS 223.65]KDO31401.1 hypothetical protein SPRG_04018 [Saprolegnia parasitica CBS 223.65]|eukprot:XP_012197998.1 hypothetical protein SPRG_04018 [Saprolegnia parasitica CBS 223.65]